MNRKSIIYFKKEASSWRIWRGKAKFSCYQGFSRLLRELSTLVLDKDAVISGRLEVVRKKKT